MATTTAKKKPLDTPPVFLWESVDKRGKVMKGEMTGRNEGLVKAELRRKRLDVKVVKPKPRRGGGAIKPKDIAVMSRQLATMMQSGAPTGTHSIPAAAKGAAMATVEQERTEPCASPVSPPT